MTCTPASLVASAICYAQELSRDDLSAIQVYLACAWANAMDPDALAFITAAGITDSDQKAAVNKLVLDLKNTGTPSYWSRDILIYPFVGGTALAHSINLKNPALYTLTYGASITHGARGMKGAGDANTWADTVYVPAAPLSLNDIRCFVYLDAECTLNAHSYFGVRGVANGWFIHRRQTAAGGPSQYVTDDLTLTNYDGTGVSKLGAWITQRINATTKQIACQGNALTSSAVPPVAFPDLSFYLLADHSAGGVTALTQSDARISGWSLGTQLTNAEWLEYRGIWETFQTALSRNLP